MHRVKLRLTNGEYQLLRRNAKAAKKSIAGFVPEKALGYKKGGGYSKREVSRLLSAVRRFNAMMKRLNAYPHVYYEEMPPDRVVYSKAVGPSNPRLLGRYIPGYYSENPKKCACMHGDAGTC